MPDLPLIGDYYLTERDILVRITSVDNKYVDFEGVGHPSFGSAPLEYVRRYYRRTAKPNIYLKALRDIEALMPAKARLPIIHQIKEILDSVLPKP